MAAESVDPIRLLLAATPPHRKIKIRKAGKSKICKSSGARTLYVCKPSKFYNTPCSLTESLAVTLAIQKALHPQGVPQVAGTDPDSQ